MTQLSTLVLWDGEGVDNEYIYTYIYKVKDFMWNLDSAVLDRLVLITCLRLNFSHSTDGGIKYVTATVPLNN